MAAKSKGYVPHGSRKILVFPDLSAETLEAHRKLRPVTSLLQKANIQYRWVAYAKILVQHKGSSFMASDLDSGAKLLEDLGVELPSDFHRPVDTTERPIWQTPR